MASTISVLGAVACGPAGAAPTFEVSGRLGAGIFEGQPSDVPNGTFSGTFEAEDLPVLDGLITRITAFDLRVYDEQGGLFDELSSATPEDSGFVIAFSDDPVTGLTFTHARRGGLNLLFNSPFGGVGEAISTVIVGDSLIASYESPNGAFTAIASGRSVAVPEPAALVIAVLGAVGLLGFGRRLFGG